MTPCFGARLVQEGNRLHYLADRAGIRGGSATRIRTRTGLPLLMKQLELMLTSGELNPRHQHTVTVCERADLQKPTPSAVVATFYLAVYPTPETKSKSPE